MDPLVINRRDGSRMELHVWPTATAKGPPILIMPAMGVPGGYYRPLAEALAAQGFPIVVGEQRGHGRSGVRPSRRVDFGYHDLLSEDWPAMVEATAGRFPGARPVLLGHSLGGQLGLLHAGRRPRAFSAIVLAAACSVHYRSYPGIAGLAIRGYARFGPPLARIVGHFPGYWLGFAGREAHGMIRDWGEEVLTGRYRLAGSPHDDDALLAGIDLPVLAISLDTDRLAPRAAVDRLAGKLSGARVERAHWRAADLGDPGFDHFTWVRRPAIVAERIAGWLRQALPPYM